MAFDPDAFGEDVGAMVRELVAPMVARIKSLEATVAALQAVPAIKGGLIDDSDELIFTRTDGEIVRVGRVRRDAETVNVDVDDVGKVAARELRDEMLERADTIVREWLAANPPQRGEKGDSGVGVAGAMMDADGTLLITTSNGEVHRVGNVKGRDGADFSEVTFDYDGERTIVIRGKNGDIHKRLPVPIDRGYWRDGMLCEKGDIVTDDGSAWIALQETRLRPGFAHKEQWRMFARKGRDGKDGRDGIDKTAAVKAKPTDDR